MGSKAIPAILLSPVVVTKDNVKETVIKEVLKHGNHSETLPKEESPQEEAAAADLGHWTRG